MKGAYIILKAVWSSIPSGLKRFVRSIPALNGVKAAFASTTAKYARFDDIYNAAYYAGIEAASVRSAGVIAKSIVTEFSPHSVVDVGCGTGAVLRALRDRGVPDVRGIERSSHGIARCRDAGFEVMEVDLCILDGVSRFAVADVVVSLEVAEHLPALCSDSFVGLLCSIAPRVVVTAAPPGQSGTHHVNEQPSFYWMSLFERHGFLYLGETTERLRNVWRSEGATHYYWQNLLVFSRAEQMP